MDKHWSAVCSFILVLCAFVNVHMDLVEGALKDVQSLKGSYGPCFVLPYECQNDSDCSGNGKCCPIGCGSYCFFTNPGKNRNCTNGSSMCAEYCDHDRQCPGEQKCCRTTCGHACRFSSI
uniref:WAP domain-containing protein n=1 Tax=Sphaeramia orbicularis TaxID=375764 RepID=A0A672YS20_9TELE